MTTTPTPTTYPVRVDAHLDQHVSRWLWLVKWLLAIPHYIVLAFLWTAFSVTTFMAFFAILVTGRYPRVLFDFNVGVLRWHWRVTFYSYGVLGTDRYPPFSLHDVADYPAHLEVEHPERMSRGLVLVKWWLLAIPHYLVVSVLVGGAYVAQGNDDNPTGIALLATDLGLISVLVLIAAVALLFRGTYLVRLFDLLVGLNRWILRVTAYVTLMTDRYPPFALDQGGADPATHIGDGLPGEGSAAEVATGPTTQTEAPAPAPAPAAAPRRGSTSSWTPGKVVSLVVGSALIMTSLGLLGAAAAVFVVGVGTEDEDGFHMSRTETFESPTHAITSGNLELHTDPPGDSLPDLLLGKTRLTARPGGDAELFVGIGPTADVRSYLSGVSSARLTDIRDGEPVYTTQAGTAPTSPPTEQSFWEVQDYGAGERSLTWELSDGDWTVVVMNADGSAPVVADVRVGAELPVLGAVSVTFLLLAGISFLVGVVLVAVAVFAASRRSSRR